MSDPILAALADTQHRLTSAIAEANYERRHRHHLEHLLEKAHRMIADQHDLIELLGGQVAA